MPCSGLPAAPWSSATTAGSSTVSPLTFSPSKETARPTGSKATSRSTPPTSGAAKASRSTSLTGFATRNSSISMSLPRSKHVVLPPRLEGLGALVSNLSWSWNREARALVRSIDPPLWRQVRQNPIELLREIPSARLEQLAHDPKFLEHYDRV